MGLAFAFDNNVNRAVSAAIRGGIKSTRQELYKGADRRERITAGSRVDIANLVSVAHVGRTVPRQGGECFSRAGIRIIKNWRGFEGGFPIDRQHVLCKASVAV